MTRRAPGTARILFFMLCFGTAALCPLLAADDPAAKPPVDPDPDWKLGLTQFRENNLSRENKYLASSFPLLIRERIIGVKSHRLGEEERIALRKALLNAELKKEITSLLQLQKTRDEALFNETKDYLKKKINEDYTKNSAFIRERIASLRALDIEKIEVKAEKTISLKDNNGVLFPPPPFSALRYIDEIKVDALLWGTVEEIQGYLYCELNVFSRTLEKNIFTFKEAGKPQELFASLEKAIPDLLSALLGREWASLLVDVNPAFSFIKVNGALIGMGTVEALYLEPGEITLAIESPGYARVEKKILLEPRKRVVEEVELEKGREESLLVESVPMAADVYLNSLWIGKTPLVLEKPNITSRLSLISEGFYPEYFRLGPGTAETSLMIPLFKTTVDFDRLKEKTRSRYYSSLAAFLLTLPVPVISYSLAYDFGTAGRWGECEFWAATYYWTAFIAGALFVNMIYDLYRYIISHDKPVG